MSSSVANLRLQAILRHLDAGNGESKQRILWDSTSAASFRYTLDNSRLSLADREFYEENGYIVIKKLVPDYLLDKYEKRFLDICERRVPKSIMTLMKDVSQRKSTAIGQEVIYKINDFVFDDVLFEYCCLPQILEYVECFAGSNIVTINTMLVNKPPDSGTLTSRHPLHQDSHYFPIRPVDRIVCSWTAMERVHRQNGCLVVIPGSHKGGLLPHGYPEWEGGVNKMYLGIKSYSNELPRLHLDMEKGDTVFFHPILIHGSGANKTKGFRKAISCHYAASECHYFDVKGTPQEAVAQEVLDIAAKRGAFLNDFSDVFRLRVRVVRGERINL